VAIGSNVDGAENGVDSIKGGAAVEAENVRHFVMCRSSLYGGRRRVELDYQVKSRKDEMKQADISSLSLLLEPSNTGPVANRLRAIIAMASDGTTVTECPPKSDQPAQRVWRV
jgi:hypothetical protein